MNSAISTRWTRAISEDKLRHGELRIPAGRPWEGTVLRGCRKARQVVEYV